METIIVNGFEFTVGQKVMFRLGRMNLASGEARSADEKMFRDAGHTITDAYIEVNAEVVGIASPDANRVRVRFPIHGTIRECDQSPENLNFRE